MLRINSKKLVFLLAFLGFVLASSAQSKQDTSTIPPFSGKKPFRHFSVGVNVGALNPSLIIGGSNDFAKPQTTLGFGANVHYQLNHLIGFQADYLGGTLEGNQGDASYASSRTVSSFKTNFDYNVSLSGVLTFGNINWLHQKNYVVPYVSLGAGMSVYNPKIVKLGSTEPEDYHPDGAIKQFFVPVAAGVKINLSTRLNLDLGYRMHFVDKDDLDGYNFSTSRDRFGYGFAGLDISLGKKNKPQMLFDNPAARATNALQRQIDTVKQEQVKLSSDSDGDGVSDMFDKEPNTPAGCPVDAHGLARDTDGDGVPDCKDKELVTPTQCQPVDADGVGKCPEPDCCKAIRDSLAAVPACNLTNLPSISFKSNKTDLSSDAKAMLATVASDLKSSAACSISVTGYPAASKASQALCNKRTELIKKYLVETEGISADRIDVNCEVGGGDINTVDIRSK